MSRANQAGSYSASLGTGTEFGSSGNIHTPHGSASCGGSTPMVHEAALPKDFRAEDKPEAAEGESTPREVADTLAIGDATAGSMPSPTVVSLPPGLPPP